MPSTRALLAIIAATLGITGLRAEAAGRPNVVLIYADDLGYGDLGCYGSKSNPTPNLDRMAAEGVRFTNFYVAQAVCSASRAALLTGRYPQRVGILGALGPNSRSGLAETDQTIATVLKKRDYATAIFGKWHLGHLSEFLPTRRGFDLWYGLPYSNDMWPNHPTAKFPPLPLMESTAAKATEVDVKAGQPAKILGHDPDQTRLTTDYTERAVSFIKANKERPFFLYVAHNMPHVPLFVSAKHAGKSGAGLYADVIMEIDWSVGQILKTLKEQGLDDKTLVIFTSDNGPWLSYGDHAGSAGPLREGKGTSWEGGIRVPCVARWPGRIRAGAVCHEMAVTIDILPTLAKIADAPLPPQPLDGKNILPLLLGEAGAKSPHDALFFWWGKNLQAVRSGKWKLHLPHPYTSLEGRPGGTAGKPAKYSTLQTPLALYDLEADIAESKNVADGNPEIVARLTRLAERQKD